MAAPAREGHILIADLRGGESDRMPATIAPNQVAVAQDIDYYRGTLGGRRNGSELRLQNLANEINHLILHRPLEADEGELFTLDDIGAWKRYSVAYAPTVVTPSPADTFLPLQSARGATLHGKLFIAAPTTASAVALNRLHVWDGTNLRRTGVAAPVLAPAVANQGVGGFAGTRYYRVRFAVLSGTTVLRRSEPSPETTFAPSGAGASARITKPATVNEGETHWEIEESSDGTLGNWYRIARVVVGTTTYDDTIDLPQNVAIATGAILSDDIGDHTLQQSYKFVVIDRDRVLGFGNHTDSSKGSSVEWSVVGSDRSSVGNDERVPTDTANHLDLDGQESGDIKGAGSLDGNVYAFKHNRIYCMTQTGVRANSYLPQIVSSTYGAIEGSVVEGTDETGRAALYFLDPELGPMRLSNRNGFEEIAPHLTDKFGGEINFAAAYSVVNAVHHPGRGQVWWHIAGVRRLARGCCPPATILPNWPSFRWCYDIESGGSSFHSLPRLARASVLWQGKPHITCEGGGLVECDVDEAPDDYGETFRAYFVTRAFSPGEMLDQFQFTGSVIEGRSIQLSPGRRLGCETPSNVNLIITYIRDYDIERQSVLFNLDPPSGAPQAGYVIKKIDNSRLAEATAMQIEIGDVLAVSQSPWALFRLALRWKTKAANVK